MPKGGDQKMIKHSYIKIKGLNLIFIKDSKSLQIESK